MQILLIHRMSGCARALAKAPGFSLLVVVVLAFGIGLSTALFSVVDAVLLQPLAVDAQGRIVAIETAWPHTGEITPRVSGGDLIDLRAHARSLSAVAVYDGGELGVQIGKASHFARTFKVDPFFFAVLGIPPVTGRLPGAEDAEDTAVVTKSFALASWGSVSAGTALQVEQRSYRVVGIVDDVYAFPEGAQVWITGPKNPDNQNHTAFNYRAIARLKRGASLAQAGAELQRLHEDDRTFRPLLLRDEVAGPARVTLLFLFGATALLLLIACGNAANLILVRTAQRNREIAIRFSVGASVRQVLQLIALESFLLTAVATAIGILIAYGALHALYPLLPASLPRSRDVLHMHVTVLLFASAACAFTVLLCSIAPILYVRRIGITDGLKRSSGRGAVGAGRRSRQFLVAGQVALSCLLCVAALLLSRSLVALDTAELGFNPANVIVMYADAPAFHLAEYFRAIQTFKTAISSIQRLPGVRSAAAVMGLPTGRYGSNGNYWVEGVDIQPGQDLLKTNWTGRKLPYANFAVATDGYFRTVGIPLLRGRDFNETDRYDRPFTAVISQALARRSFGGADPVGRRIYCGLDSPQPMTIVGIVGDVRQDSPASSMDPEIYMPLAQHPYFANEVEFVVQSGSSAELAIPAIRGVMKQEAPSVAIGFTTLVDMVHDSVSAPRFRAILSVAFAAVATLLAIAGLYAVLVFEVNQQRLDIGIRMALGATATSVIGLIVRRAFAMCSLGVIVGLALAAALARFVTSLVYGITPLDPLTYYLAALAILVSVGVAAAGPSWRAARVDPSIALRSDG